MENSPKNLLDQTKAARQARHAWYFYDFGNSAYASVILLSVYSTYFKNVVVGGAEGTRLWGLSVGIAAIILAEGFLLPRRKGASQIVAAAPLAETPAGDGNG